MKPYHYHYKVFRILEISASIYKYDNALISYLQRYSWNYENQSHYFGLTSTVVRNITQILRGKRNPLAHW